MKTYAQLTASLLWLAFDYKKYILLQCDIGYTGTEKYCGLDSDLDCHPDITLPCTDWGCYRVCINSVLGHVIL